MTCTHSFCPLNKSDRSEEQVTVIEHLDRTSTAVSCFAENHQGCDVSDDDAASLKLEEVQEVAHGRDFDIHFGGVKNTGNKRKAFFDNF